MDEIIKNIAFISWPVTDMERAVIFYKNLFRVDPVFQQSDWAEFKIQGQRLALHLEHATTRSASTPCSALYFGATSIETSVENLKTRGISFDGPIQVFPYGKLIHFKDPDGNLLGLYESPSKIEVPNSSLK